jgi:hypothetical protein
MLYDVCDTQTGKTTSSNYDTTSKKPTKKYGWVDIIAKIRI